MKVDKLEVTVDSESDGTQLPPQMTPSPCVSELLEDLVGMLHTPYEH